MKVHHIALPHNLIALLKYSLSGTAAVIADIAVLYFLVSANVPNLIAVSISISISGIVHYIICRYFVFRTFNRTFLAGFVYFISIVGFSVVLNMGLYLTLIAILPLHFTVVRAISIALVGIISFLMNAHYNFGTLSPKK